jgi:purine-binding chemotaxis protein CheW
MTGSLFCTFRVGGLLLGIPIDRVVEVLADQPVTPVPLAHPAIVGLLNLRGQVVTAVDARRRLGLGEGKGTRSIAVLRLDGELTGLVVDRPGDVIDIAEDRLEAVPDTVRAEIHALTTAAVQLEDDLLLVLDPHETLAVTS